MMSAICFLMLAGVSACPEASTATNFPSPHDSQSHVVCPVATTYPILSPHLTHETGTYVSLPVSDIPRWVIWMRRALLFILVLRSVVMGIEDAVHRAELRGEGLGRVENDHA